LITTTFENPGRKLIPSEEAIQDALAAEVYGELEYDAIVATSDWLAYGPDCELYGSRHPLTG
jgi:hypothetical protein